MQKVEEEEDNIQNDNFCDLPDGSDETKTSACSYLKVYFTCNYDQKQIPTSRVQDGVCDCCDGSDEIDSPFPTICQPKCGPDAHAFLPKRRINLRRHNHLEPVRLPLIKLQQLPSAHAHHHSSLKGFLHTAPFLGLVLMAVAYLIAIFCRSSSNRSPFDPSRNSSGGGLCDCLGLFRKLLWGFYYCCNLFRWKKADAHMV